MFHNFRNLPRIIIQQSPNFNLNEQFNFKRMFILLKLENVQYIEINRTNTHKIQLNFKNLFFKSLRPFRQYRNFFSLKFCKNIVKFQYKIKVLFKKLAF